MATRRPSSDAPGCTWISEFFLSRYSVPSPLSLWWMANLIDPAACSDMLTSDASGSFSAFRKEPILLRIIMIAAKMMTFQKLNKKITQIKSVGKLELEPAGARAGNRLTD
uniref:(northern house mosquito) hypothetical protein n=1 Tax=Culex pipiens TaxID=7175 RepID=A0A8D8IFX5_CULPI